MTRRLLCSATMFLAFCLALLAPPDAVAQDRQDPIGEETHLASRYGMSVFVGGGVGAFADADMREVTGNAAVWEARLNFGTLLPIAVEAAYFGGAQSIDMLGIEGNAWLLTTGGEANARLNVLTTSVVQPYVFAGAGVARYDLMNVDQNNSSVEESDLTLIVPVGVGLGFRIQQFLLDVRGTYRMAFYEDLVPQVDEQSATEGLDTWSVGLRAGFEF